MKKVLFVNQDMMPYVEETELSKQGRFVPQKVMGKGCEIRTFMPRWGVVNERRGQLHEVIRLSGINITIDDTDHPLIIKVASIPAAKMQVYFIDNEEFFIRRGQVADAEGNVYEDNGERSVFFVRGVIETIKKLRWVPDVIHCQGWMSALLAIMVKDAYQDEPAVNNAKIVMSIIDQPKQDALQENIKNCIAYNTITPEMLDKYGETFSSDTLLKIAIDYADGVVISSEGISEDIVEYAKANAKKLLVCTEEEKAEKIVAFYDQIENKEN